LNPWACGGEGAAGDGKGDADGTVERGVGIEEVVVNSGVGGDAAAGEDGGERGVRG
jgi:hypothetical protein